MEEMERVRAAAGRLLERLEQAVEELDKGTVTLREKVKTDIKDYVAKNGADSVKNSTAQDPQYYLTTPDLVVYARAKAQ